MDKNILNRILADLSFDSDSRLFYKFKILLKDVLLII